MRILLVTLTDILPHALTQVLNPANDYCAIVLDDEETAKKILANVPPLRDKVRPFYELKECVEKFYYDVALCICDGRFTWKIHRQLIKYGLPRTKFFHIHVGTLNFNVEKTLRYYKEHAADFEMFATGISYTSVALDANNFKYKLFNFALSSQDLYYDYQVAKFVFSTVHGGGYEKSLVKYALIGLAPYSFQYDLSKAYANIFQLLKYYVAFNDVHNFWMPKEDLPKIINPKYLAIRLPSQVADVKNVYGERSSTVVTMDWEKHVTARENKIDDWKGRHYPDTVKENVKILDDYLTLCENNNVRPIMFLPTMTQGYIKYFERNTLDEFYYFVNQAQRKHHAAVFFDGWKLNFPDRDFYDASHLNLNGAAKFSAILNNVIEQLER